jgi:hypothetical protein
LRFPSASSDPRHTRRIATFPMEHVEKLEAPRKTHFTRVCDSRRRQRSRQHCQQFGDFLRVAGGVGSDATAEAVDGRAEAVELDVVDSRIVDVG